MPLPTLGSVVRCAGLLTPHRTAALVQRILTAIAVAQGNARWIAMVGRAQSESSTRHCVVARANVRDVIMESE